jgi:3-phosphoshikimate 1-carboxyvinyltransferase
MLRYLGADIRCEGKTVFLNGGVPLKARDIKVPGDPSSAAFLLVAATITGNSDLLVRNVSVNPTRIGYLGVLQRMGASIQRDSCREVCGEPVADLRAVTRSLRATTIGPDEVPSCVDEIPVLCVAAAFAEGTTVITGAGELRVKESDRIAAMARNLERMGVSVKEMADGLEIEGRGTIDAFEGESFQDHRVAMSLAVAAMAARGPCTVRDASCMNISFPGFVETLSALQAR